MLAPLVKSKAPLQTKGVLTLIERQKSQAPGDSALLGLKEDMRVLELMPGGGWYTRLLAPVLNDNGQLYLDFCGTRR